MPMTCKLSIGKSVTANQLLFLKFGEIRNNENMKGFAAWRSLTCFLGFSFFLAYLYLAANLHFLFYEFRQFYGQYAVLYLGGDGILLHVVRQNEGLLEP